MIFKPLRRLFLCVAIELTQYYSVNMATKKTTKNKIAKEKLVPKPIPKPDPIDCSKCHHYEKIDDKHGQCFRFPPTVGTKHRPVVQAVDRICGEFKEVG